MGNAVNVLLGPLPALVNFIGGYFKFKNNDAYEVEKRSYTESNFRAIYKKTPKEQSVSSVLKGLKKEHEDKSSKMFYS